MKKIILLIGLSFSSYIVAQIGINTESPNSLLHIDALNNTVAGANISDDAIVDNIGNMGLNTLSPTAKLHIEKFGTTSPLRISDGTEQNTRMLESDANGYASWVNQPAAFTHIDNIMTPSIFPHLSITLLSELQITETGNYLVSIRWWGVTTATTGKIVSAYFYLDREATSGSTQGVNNQDVIEYYTTAVVNNPFTFTTSLFAYATAGEWLKVFIQPSTGLASWYIGGAASTSGGGSVALCPSIVYFKI